MIFAKIGKLSLALSLCLWIYKMPLQQKKKIWASTHGFVLCEQQRYRSACAPAQSDLAFVIRYLDSIIAKLLSEVLRF